MLNCGETSDRSQTRDNETDFGMNMGNGNMSGRRKVTLVNMSRVTYETK